VSVLPSREGLDIGALSRLFDSLAFSYKHLFFNALLHAFKDTAFRAATYSLDDLAVGMLAAAWHPSRVYRLSLGLRDQIAGMLEKIDLESDRPIPHSQLRARIAGYRINCKPLMRYVPQRLLTPFFENHLRGTKDQQRDAEITRLASEQFTTARPLYRFAGSEAIELHPDWAEYLAANFPIVTAWAERCWIGYLQARNPTVPAVSEKTAAPLNRASVESQTRYWKTVFSASGELPRCIYSGSALNPDRFALDHFLPWTFICHDALWNLIPVSQEANAAKSNRLPDVSYVQLLADAQHRGLVAARRVMKDSAWTKATGSFVGDLRIPEDQLLDPSVLLEAYHRSVGAQLDIARVIGFQPGWKFAS
jgi:hypothetical protein